LRSPSLSCSLFPYTTLFRSDHRPTEYPVGEQGDVEQRGGEAELTVDEDRAESEPDADEGEREQRSATRGEFGDPEDDRPHRQREDRKSTRLNSSHVSISYAV